MTRRSRLLESIAGTIADYRAGEISLPTSAHVERWIEQFDGAAQEPILAELDHILDHTYIPKKEVQRFLVSLLKNKELAGADLCSFWANVEFLDIQGGGNSQREMLGMFDEVLQAECNFKIDDCGGDPEAYIYLDDAIFTGNRIRSDLSSWIQTDAPEKAKVHVVTIALHREGRWYAKNGIQQASDAASKKVSTSWWRCVEIEDRKRYVDSSDVLRPASLPSDELTREYVQRLRYPPVLRKAGSVGGNEFFSSEEGRHLLEQEFLKAGLRIRSECPHLNDYQRPLGNMVLETLGFGALLVTFRNCPNNCPLAFWAGDPWYPLFPRKTN